MGEAGWTGNPVLAGSRGRRNFWTGDMQRSAKRFRKAILYAEAHNLHLVFALLAKPWAGRASRLAFVGVPEKIAVVVADWKGFGALPIPQWGRAIFGKRVKKYYQ